MTQASAALRATALLNPETSILIQKRHPYTRSLHSETPGDSKNAFLHWGDVSALLNPETSIEFRNVIHTVEI